MSNAKLRDDLLTARRTLEFYESAAMSAARQLGFAQREAAHANERIRAFKGAPLHRRLLAAWRNEL